MNFVPSTPSTPSYLLREREHFICIIFELLDRDRVIRCRNYLISLICLLYNDRAFFYSQVYYHYYCCLLFALSVCSYQVLLISGALTNVVPLWFASSSHYSTPYSSPHPITSPSFFWLLQSGNILFVLSLQLFTIKVNIKVLSKWSVTRHKQRSAEETQRWAEVTLSTSLMAVVVVVVVVVWLMEIEWATKDVARKRVKCLFVRMAS